ncbi:MAG: shikimate kinase [Verrucomicrobiota bacterium]
MTGRGKSIVLIGFMGAGKSSVGRRLAQLTELPRFDTDEMIAEDFGVSVAQIFAKHGEKAFRDAETRMLRRLRRGSGTIIATGGGIVLRPENVELLKKLGCVVHLDVDEETLFGRLMRGPARPLIQTENLRAIMKKLLSERAPLYLAAADIVLRTSPFTQQEVASAILWRMQILRNESR